MNDQLSLFQSEKEPEDSANTLFELLPQVWQDHLEAERAKPYFPKLDAFLAEEWKNEEVFPERENLFTAFNETPFEDVRVLLLGQDPYHDVGQAHGLSFSVLPGVKTPPSLRNMYKELHSDLGCEIPQNGNLMPWAKQGVLLLNAVLTVRAHQAGSHKRKGWETFTDAVIRAMDARKAPVIFLLWGGFAKKKAALIRGSQHRVIEGTHPSPLSANNGFFGSKPFSQVNDALEQLGNKPIDWQIPNSTSV